MPKEKIPLYERFWSKVEQASGCWKWRGATVHGGYGILNRGSRGEGLIRAHRYSYLLHYGVIPDGMYVLHKCDNPECTNPEHLYTGDAKQNMRDVSERKRHPASRKTHCKRGHEYNEENTKWRGNKRECRACKRILAKAALRKKRGDQFGIRPRETKTHCKRGHKFTDENTYTNPKGYRECVQCRKERMKAFMDKKNANL